MKTKTAPTHEMKIYSLAEWRAEGVRRFGDKWGDWQFICPRCKTRQSGHDMIEATGEGPDYVERYFGFSCIGRFTTKKGCDWTLGGLFQIHRAAIIDEKGKTIPVFEFAEPTS